MRVFVLDTKKRPLSPCVPGRARRLLKLGRAAVYRLQPFTIILKREVTDPVIAETLEFKADPGSKTTGMVIVCNGDVIFAANLEHRGQRIRKLMESRRSLRRGRRNRKTRYRAPRFDNRTRREGWLPPSIQSRVDNVVNWYIKLLRLAPITECHVETVRFDMQKMENPEISGVEYQRGTLAGYELSGYLLAKWNHQCAYCGAKGVPLEKEHIVPRSKGGSNRVSNLAIACHDCNQKKGNQDIQDFLRKKPDVLKRVLAQAKAPLRDAAAVNAARNAIFRDLRAIGLLARMWSGGRTKMNRAQQGYEKDHWIDAACCGESGAAVNISQAKPLQIKALGRGSRNTQACDKYGFPRGKAGRIKRVHGFAAGDFVRLVQPSGKYAGAHTGRLAGIRADGRLDIASKSGKITSSFKNFSLLQYADGYSYAY